jgi:hypothetical protein
MSKEWRDVFNYEGIYFVSNYGDIKNRYGKILSFDRRSDMYCRICLCKNNIKKNHYVHRLVLAAFIGDRADMQCNHKDGNRSNNRIENLEWMTSKENVNYSFDVLGKKMPRGQQNPVSIFQDKDIYYIRGSYDGTRGSISKIAKEMNANPQTIANIIQRKSWTHI